MEGWDMKGRTISWSAVAGMAALLAGLAFSAAAGASPGQSSTTHFSSVVDQLGTPAGPTTNDSSGCPGPVINDFVDVNGTGNGVMHSTANANGFWATSTFTG